MSRRQRRRTVGFHLASVLWLTGVWVLLWGGLSAANVLGGVVVAMLVVTVLPMPEIEFHGRVHLLSLLYLAYRFVADLAVASFQVAARALDPRSLPHGAVLAVHLRSHSDLYLTLTSELVSLIPGSIVVEAHRITGMLYVHILDVPMAGGVEEAREHVLDTEARVLRAFASDEELEEAGLTRKPLPRVPHPAWPVTRR